MAKTSFTTHVKGSVNRYLILCTYVIPQVVNSNWGSILVPNPVSHETASYSSLDIVCYMKETFNKCVPLWSLGRLSKSVVLNGYRAGHSDSKKVSHCAAWHCCTSERCSLISVLFTYHRGSIVRTLTVKGVFCIYFKHTVLNGVFIMPCCVGEITGIVRSNKLLLVHLVQPTLNLLCDGRAPQGGSSYAHSDTDRLQKLWIYIFFLSWYHGQLIRTPMSYMWAIVTPCIYITILGPLLCIPLYI